MSPQALHILSSSPERQPRPDILYFCAPEVVVGFQVQKVELWVNVRDWPGADVDDERDFLCAEEMNEALEREGGVADAEDFGAAGGGNVSVGGKSEARFGFCDVVGRSGVRVWAFVGVHGVERHVGVDGGPDVERGELFWDFGSIFAGVGEGAEDGRYLGGLGEVAWNGGVFAGGIGRVCSAWA